MKILKQSPYLIVKDSLWRRLIRGLYYKYLDELYIPKEVSIHIIRLPKVHGKNWGKIDKIRIGITDSKKGLRKGVQEVYLNATEDTNGIEYLVDKKIEIC